MQRLKIMGTIRTGVFFAMAIAAVLAIGFSSTAAIADDRPELNFAVDNLWPTMDPVAPAAPETNTVSPASGRPMSRRPK